MRPRAIDLNGEQAIVVLMRNITERNQLEHQLLQSQKMEAIGTLAGGVAHDFNNMLSAIISYGHLLKGRLNKDETAGRYLEEIQKASDRASILTNQLLTFSRRQVVKARVINVNQVINNLDGMFRRLIREDIELVHSLDKDLWLTELDPNQMEQILVNLVINARDAMPEGGKLQIKTANETIPSGHSGLPGSPQPGDYVTLAISDTGIGMSGETKSRVFEPFFTTKDPGKGTGLGLSTTFGIVAQSDGIIEVESELGKGSEFKIYLPRTLASTEFEVIDKSDEGLPTGVEAILVVDDESTVRGATASVLREQGYEVYEAANGIEAIEIANRQSNIRLLLTDMVMPIMSGRMLAQHFDEHFPAIKLLLMSGYTDDKLIQDEVRGGHVPFLQKPLMPDALARKVREVLDSS